MALRRETQFIVTYHWPIITSTRTVALPRTGNVMRSSLCKVCGDRRTSGPAEGNSVSSTGSHANSSVAAMEADALTAVVTTTRDRHLGASRDISSILASC